jgi:hypothetical protein
MTKLSRQTSIYRMSSPSIKQRNRMANWALKVAEASSNRLEVLERAINRLAREHGSSLTPGEWTLTLPATDSSNGEHLDKIDYALGDQGQIVVKVTTPPEVLEQIEAFKKELEEAHGTVTAQVEE